jgi:hypothetical protein
VVGGTPGDGGGVVVAGAGGVVAPGVGAVVAPPVGAVVAPPVGAVVALPDAVLPGDAEVVEVVADRFVEAEGGGTAPGCGWNGGGSSGAEVCPSAIPPMVSSTQAVMPITGFTFVPPRADSRPPP